MTERALFGREETRQARQELAELDRLDKIAANPDLEQEDSVYRYIGKSGTGYTDPHSELCKCERAELPYLQALLAGMLVRRRVGDRRPTMIRAGKVVFERLEGAEAATAVTIEDGTLYRRASSSSRAAAAMHAEALVKVEAAKEALSRAQRDLESAVDQAELAADTQALERGRLDSWLKARNLTEAGLFPVLELLEQSR